MEVGQTGHDVQRTFQTFEIKIKNAVCFQKTVVCLSFKTGMFCAYAGVLAVWQCLTCAAEGSGVAGRRGHIACYGCHKLVRLNKERAE